MTEDNLHNHPAVGRIGFPIMKLSLFVRKLCSYHVVWPVVLIPQLDLCKDDMSEDGHIKSWWRETIVVTISTYIALCQGIIPVVGI